MKTMKKIAVYAILQGIVIFLITGLITQFIRGDFFFRNLAPTLYDEEAKQEKAPTGKEAE